MSTHVQPYIVSFPEGFDEQAEFELPYRGYLPDVIVGSEDGTRHRLTFIDTDNVVTNDFSTCPGLERSFAGDVISFPQWVKDAGGCAPPLPDLLFSLDTPSYTPELTRHYHVLAIVHVTYVRHGLFTSSTLQGTEFLAQRDGWTP